eukprot:728661_1
MAEQLEQKAQAMNPMILAERVELFIASGDLTFSNTFCVVSMKHSRGKDFEMIDKTETIGGNQNPTRWTKRFRMDYFFEEEQILRFDVFDEDKKGSNKLKDHDILGSCTMVIGEIVHETGCIMAKKLMHKGRALRNKKTKKYSSLIATVEQINASGNELITMQFSANGLPKMDGLFGKADPYFLIQRAREDGKWITVYGNREDNIRKTLNP